MLFLGKSVAPYSYKVKHWWARLLALLFRGTVASAGATAVASAVVSAVANRDAGTVAICGSLGRQRGCQRSRQHNCQRSSLQGSESCVQRSLAMTMLSWRRCGWWHAPGPSNATCSWSSRRSGQIAAPVDYCTHRCWCIDSAGGE
jgi:hypothetical protein